VRVSRIGVKVDPILRARYFPVPNQSRIIGKERPFAGDHLLHEKGRLGLVGSEVSNLGEILVVAEHIREDHGVPCRGGHLKRVTGSAFWHLAREIMSQWRCEVKKRLGDLSIGKPHRAFGHLVLSTQNLYCRPADPANPAPLSFEKTTAAVQRSAGPAAATFNTCL
jgi:hypothetical protein